MVQAGSSQAGGRKQGRKLQQGEAICRKHIERVSQEFIGACPKMIERPTLAKDLSEFRDTEEVRCLLLQGIEAHGNERISRVNNNELLVQMTAKPLFLGPDCSEEKLFCVAMQIEINETAARCNVLRSQMSE